MKKKYRVIIAILAVLAIVVVVGGCALNNNKSNQTDNEIEDNQIIINIPEEDKNETTEEKEEVVEAESTEGQDEEQEELPSEPVEEFPMVIFDESTSVSAWTTSNLNLREQPNGNSKVLTVIPQGTEIKKGTEENGWAHVKVGDTIGYVSTQYISDTKPEEKLEEKPVEENVTPTPNTSKIEAIPGQQHDPNNIVIVIDPGHQLRGDSNKEPNGPGSTTMKARVTGGTTGVATGVAEYILNLDVSLKLKAELENRGYVVHMTRATHDVNISNKERAEYANSVNADIAVRIHANGAGPSVRGAETLAPSASNPYVSHLSNASVSLSRHVLNAYCEATGFSNRGVKTNDTMTGINWSSVPVTIIELGFMSNADEDRAMQDTTMQNNMVQGIANGIDAYFGM